MRLFLLKISFFCLPFIFVACKQDADEVIAYVGNSAIYESDLNWFKKEKKFDKFTEDLYIRNTELLSSEAVLQEGLKLYPELKKAADENLKAMHSRILTAVYQQYFTMENLRFSDKELLAFYKKDTTKFVSDSLDNFKTVKGNVAEALYIEKYQADFDAFLQESLNQLTVPASVQVLYKSIKERASAENLLEKIKQTTVLNKDLGFVQTKIDSGMHTGMFAAKEIQQHFFENPDLEKQGMIPLANGEFLVYQLETKTKAVVAKKEAVLKTAKKKFIEKVKQNFINTTGQKLVDKYKLELAALKPIDKKTYYETHKELFQTAPGLVIYHIQKADSSALSKIMLNIKDFSQFEKAVSESENQETKKQGGFVGKILENHALPYGIGILENLFTDFKNGKTGISKIYKTENGYHVFYVKEHVKQETKPFERVEGLIEEMIAFGSIERDSSEVSVLENGKPVLFNKDVLQLKKEFETPKRTNLTYSQLASHLMEWHAFAKEALSLKLNETPGYKAIERSVYRNFINKALADSVKKVKILSKEALKPYYEKYGRIFAGKTAEEISLQLSVLAEIKENDMRYEFYSKQSVSDTSSDYISYLPHVYKELARERSEIKWLRFSLNAESKYPLKLLTSDFAPISYAATPERYFFLADSLKGKYGRKLWYSSLPGYLYSEVDSVYAKSLFEVATIYNDENGFETAVKEYAAYIKMFPDYKDAEKAMFNLGFILDENLNRKEEALFIYKKFIEKYPESSFLESVKWLAQNIENKGKSETVLLEKIEKSEK